MSANPHIPCISGHPFVGKGSVTYCPGCDLGIVAYEPHTLGVITGGGWGGWEEEGLEGRSRVRTGGEVEEEAQNGRRRGGRGGGGAEDCSRPGFPVLAYHPEFSRVYSHT